MIPALKVATYIRVVNLPYSNHAIAKETLHRAKDSKNIKIKIPLSKFTTNKRRILRGLFCFTMQQMPWYCPADSIRVHVTKSAVVFHYVQNQQKYKGVEEL